MKIAVSGSYSTGKSTFSLALSLATGVPHTKARTMRELLPQTFPGKRLEECSTNELVELGIRRFMERRTLEAGLRKGFISDGSSLQEWVYGSGRVKAGLNPSDKFWSSKINRLLSFIRVAVFRDTMMGLECVVKDYAADGYDVVIHLPVEFPFVPDGHRPVSEKFRLACDGVLRSSYSKMNVKVIEASGSLEERIEFVCRELGLPLKMSISEVMKETKTRMEEYNRMLSQKRG